MSRLFKALALAGVLLSMQCAQGSNFDAALSAKRYQEVEREASAALAINPQDPDALYAKVEALLVLAPGSRIDEASKLAEQCVADTPTQSRCHEALGDMLGTKAMHANFVSAIAYATKIHEAYRRAIELDPHNLSVRFSLHTYYLSAPAFLGGGMTNAQALAADTATISSDGGKLMQSMIALHEGATAKAEALLSALAPSESYVLADQQSEELWNLGQRYLKDKKLTDAERVFHTLENRYPDSGQGAHGLAQVRQAEDQSAGAH